MYAIMFIYQKNMAVGDIPLLEKRVVLNAITMATAETTAMDVPTPIAMYTSVGSDGGSVIAPVTLRNDRVTF